MKCDTKKANNESYRFFEEFDTYERIVKSAENVNSVGINYLGILEEYDCDEIEKSCYYFLINNIASTNESPHIICEQFKRIYSLLKNRNRKGVDSVKSKNNDYAFMNYWLNDKLSEYFNITNLEEKLYNMEKSYLENMKNLYQLYSIKNKISMAISEEDETGKRASCLWYTKECYAKYKEAIINCRGECSYFYSLIKEFKKKYKEELSPFSEMSFSCKAKELFDLPDYRAVLKEHESIQIIRNRTLSVLLPMFGVFLMFKISDKFTPFRQYILEKIKRSKNILFGEGERDNEFLSYTSDDDSSIYNNGEYNISYYNVMNY
ncbi:PIR Superfamily Protein [Plasmodium ovale curtisi]|uniref:PIR Superfamily Protein n=1 Tax=Plasmodium ovale curtisi TaxID=864141 RepID=A0A1A8XEF4_PLAOA|nr:PIR Superfamily Protein [Plasmodium ovale curtisi]